MARRYVVLALFVLAAAAGLGAYLLGDDGNDTDTRWRLPKALNEASGLALAPDGRLLTVTDERAVVYGFDLETHDVSAVVSVGGPVKGDFEGIATLGADVYIVTSTGTLYRAIDTFIAESGDSVEVQVIDTGLNKVCEIEGLASDSGRLLLACKRNYRKEDKDRLLVFALDPGSWEKSVVVNLPFDDLPDETRLSPSGIDVDAAHYYILAAKQKQLLVLTRAGKFVEIKHLKKHRQAEGIAILPDGSLVLLDEGKKSGARVSYYRSLRDIP